MNENIKSYIKINCFLGFDVEIDNNIGAIHCPKINELNKNLLTYLYYVNKFTGLFDDSKDKFYSEIVFNKNNFFEFGELLYFFLPTKEIKFVEGNFVYNESNFIDNNNIVLFMETIKIFHHYDKKDDDYKPANKIAAEMMERARKLRKELESKQKKSNGIGFLEIMSTISARHPSINPNNISEHNYYQIIDQYKRLLKIDEYTPCLYGNATEDYIKKNNIKHYSMPILNE
jgi:hypothetical protein